MSYSQRPLIEAFLAGNVPGETGVPQHVQTVISNVFLFDTKVYKLYKNDSEFFNSGFYDLSEKSIRFAFARDDFAWNNASSPSIYTELIPVRVHNGAVEFCSSDAEADELVIGMNRVDMNEIVFHRLIKDGISVADAELIGRGVAAGLAQVRRTTPAATSYYKEFGDRIDDVDTWLRSSEDDFEEGEITRYVDYLRNVREERKEEFEQELTRELAYAGDIHSHNALFSNGKVSLMDTRSPKAEWLVEHHSTPAYRVATDLWALGGSKGHFEAFLKGYEEESGRKVNRSFDPMFIVYASLIAVPYLYMLSKNDSERRKTAVQFHSFLRDYFSRL